MKSRNSEGSTSTSNVRLRRQLESALSAFDRAGGRGVDLAEEIDSIRRELRSRAARKGWQKRKERCSQRRRNVVMQANVGRINQKLLSALEYMVEAFETRGPEGDLPPLAEAKRAIAKARRTGMKPSE